MLADYERAAADNVSENGSRRPCQLTRRERSSKLHPLGTTAEVRLIKASQRVPGCEAGGPTTWRRAEAAAIKFRCDGTPVRRSTPRGQARCAECPVDTEGL